VIGNKSSMLDDERRYYTAMEAEARGPYTGKSNVKVPRSPFIFPDLLPNVTKQVLADDAVFNLLCVSAAAYRYRAEPGRFPEGLKDLIPSFLPSLPPDPFGGPSLPPFRYRLKPGGRTFLLYSVGSDMKDNGGMPKPSPLWDSTGDIVAGQLWKGNQPAILN